MRRALRADRARTRAARHDGDRTGSRGRLCFHVPHLYPVAAGGEIDFVGGIEVQDWALARALAERGFDVAVATCDYGQAPVERRDGTTLFRTYSTDAGVPGIRFVYPRLWKTMRTLRRIRADVYLANGAGLSTGWAYDAARLSDSRFVFLAASDKDLVRSLPGLTRRRERWWYARALHGADARVAQTELQRRILRENFGLEAHVITNPVELPLAPGDVGSNGLVLWLSTYKPSKRPEWFIELARSLPALRFLMVGFPPSGDANGSWAAAKHAAAELSNLTVQGFVEHSQIGDLFRSAALFVHTSPLEGFPNTLLEAWSYGVPTVSAVDPDGVAERHGLGEVAGSIEQLARAVAATMAAPALRRALGARAREYVERHHGPDRTFDRLAVLLDRVIEREGPSRRR
jgi:glycosyltransferase involved in cell wall biosynthesis